MQLSERFNAMPFFAQALKATSIATLVVGFSGSFYSIFLWGKLSAYFETVQLALNTFWTGLGLETNPVQALPIWPLLIGVIVTLWLTVLIALGLWAASDRIQMVIRLAEEEQRQREVEMKVWRSLLDSIDEIRSWR